MNNRTHFTLSFYHLNLAIRDTLEYVQTRQSYPLASWESKKRTLEMVMKENSPLYGFCANNGENGQKIMDAVKELYDTVYGDDKTYISIEGDQAKPDHAQNIKVLDMIIPLRQTFTNVMKQYFQAQKEDNSFEQEAEDIVKLEDNFYRVIISFILSQLIYSEKFVEFNRIMRENNGVATPESNLVSNELVKLIQMYGYIKSNVNEDFEDFKQADEIMAKGISYITGQAPIPAGSSHKQEEEFITRNWFNLVAKYEPIWQQKHAEIWKQLNDFENAERAKRENTQTN
jgi:hypothetical protein